MKEKIKIAIYSLLVLLFVGCKEEYPLPDETRNLNLLVVEGNLNSAPGQTVIRLSRTLNPRDAAALRPELSAVVTVESESNNISVLSGNTKGEYTINQLNLNSNEKHRLRIKTRDGSEYLSDFIAVQNAPAIDSVSWVKGDDGVGIFVDTHDPQNKTIYYRWEYDETWEILSSYISFFRYVRPTVVERPNPSFIYRCWQTAAVNRIILGSSAKLSQDVISHQPITTIPTASIKISVRYSIIVRQYAMTQAAYNYWDIMKKNSEQLGTLFDPQPSQLKSNIHCLSDPTENVIGYLSAGSFAEKRIFIRRGDVEPWGYRESCEEIIVTLDSLEYYFGANQNIPLIEYYSPLSGRLVGYTASSTPCVDCTVRGTNTRPSFW